MSGTVRIWMALDPRTSRVLVQNREFSDGHFPDGLRGAGWPTRQADVDAAVFTELLTGRMTDEETDRLHRAWWDQARPEGAPLWPTM